MSTTETTARSSVLAHLVLLSGSTVFNHISRYSKEKREPTHRYAPSIAGGTQQ